MDLDLKKNDEKLAICKKNFFIGFALLPWLWFINGVWFFREAFFKEPFEEQKTIRRFVCFSNLCFIMKFPLFK